MLVIATLIIATLIALMAVTALRARAANIAFPLWRLLWPFYTAMQFKVWLVFVAIAAVGICIVSGKGSALIPGLHYKIPHPSLLIVTLLIPYALALGTLGGLLATITGTLRVKRSDYSFEDLECTFLLRNYLQRNYRRLTNAGDGRFLFLLSVLPPHMLDARLSHDVVEVELHADEWIIRGPLLALLAVHKLRRRNPVSATA